MLLCAHIVAGKLKPAEIVGSAQHVLRCSHFAAGQFKTAEAVGSAQYGGTTVSSQQAFVS